MLKMEIPNPMNTYKILVIGCGSIGQRYARLLSARKDVELYIADTLEENRKYCLENFRVKKAFEDYSQALEEGMDGVFICVPTGRMYLSQNKLWIREHVY